MEVSSAQFSFVVNKLKQESWQQFHIRCQAICNTFDRNPKFIDELEDVKKTSHYFVASRFMKCKYDRDIETQINKYFGHANRGNAM